jgi:hypothetical protein
VPQHGKSKRQDDGDVLCVAALRRIIFRERLHVCKAPLAALGADAALTRAARSLQLAITGAPASEPTCHNAAGVKLRNAHLAVVDRGKVVEYLLNEAHPDNGGKAKFFVSLGFSVEDPERLMKALRDVAGHGEVVRSQEFVHGEKYVVDGWLPVHTQDSGRRSVRTVWIIDRHTDAPRLVTAYPGEE